MARHPQEQREAAPARAAEPLAGKPPQTRPKRRAGGGAGSSRPASSASAAAGRAASSGTAATGIATSGAAASGTQNTTQRAPTVIMNVGPIPDGDVQYSGLAPGLVGVWQINARIPDNAPPSTATAPIQVIVLQDSTPSGGGGLGRPVTLYIKQK